jgi:putative transposase
LPAPWRAVDDEGEVLDVLLQKRRNKGAALKLLRKLLKNTGLHPETITTDGLARRAMGRLIANVPLWGRKQTGRFAPPKHQSCRYWLCPIIALC